MNIPKWSPAAQLIIERATLKALARLESIVEFSKDDKLATEASKIILARGAPEPKIDSAASKVQFSFGSESPNLQKMIERQKKIESMTMIERVEEPDSARISVRQDS